MNQLTLDDFTREFVSFVGEMNQDVDPHAIKPDDNLFDTGVLDSLSVARVIVFIEKLRGSDINLDHAGIESFSSIESMYARFIC
jgi:acyl carrier protein